MPTFAQKHLRVPETASARIRTPGALLAVGGLFFRDLAGGWGASRASQAARSVFRSAGGAAAFLLAPHSSRPGFGLGAAAGGVAC